MVNIIKIFILLISYIIYTFIKIKRVDILSKDLGVIVVITIGIVILYKKQFQQVYESIVSKVGKLEKVGLTLIYVEAFFMVSERSSTKEVLNVTVLYYVVYIIIKKIKIKGKFNLIVLFTSFSLIIGSLSHYFILGKAYKSNYLKSLKDWILILIILPVEEFIKEKKEKESVVFLLFLGILIVFFKSLSELTKALTTDYRITGTYWNTMHLTYILLLVLVYGFYIILSKKQYYYIPLIGLGTFLLILTKSRGGIITFLLIVLLLTFYYSKKSMFILIFALGITVYSIPSKEGFIKRLELIKSEAKTINKDEAYIRILMWRSNIESIKTLIKEKRIIGWGSPNDEFLKNYENVFKKSKITHKELASFKGDSHNSYLYSLTSFGIFGIPFILFFFYLLYIGSKKRYKEVRGGIYSITLAFILGQLTENLMLKASLYVFFFIVGMLMAEYNLIQEESGDEKSQRCCNNL